MTTAENDDSTTSHSLTDGPIHVSLTSIALSPTVALDAVKSPQAGANVLFAGTTRDTFDAKPVASLTYTSYAPRALASMRDIARSVHARHALTAISMTHRLGSVPIGEESILIAVSAPHRAAAWRGAEEALEQCKERVEVWKREEFEDGGVWRANRDGGAGVMAQGGDVSQHDHGSSVRAQKQREDHLRIKRT